MSAPPLPRIVIAGDVCIDWLARPMPPATREKTHRPANWQLRDGLTMFARPGGAWLLADLVRTFAGAPVASPEMPPNIEQQPCAEVLHSMLELDTFPQDRGRVWRVERFRGYAGHASAIGSAPKPPRLEPDNARAEIVVLDDVGNGFRDTTDAWPSALRQDRGLPLVVWKLARPLNESTLAERLLRPQQAERTVVVVDVDDLRAEGAAINRELSWERTTGETIRALLHDRHCALLRRAAHVIVRFDLEGAVYLANDKETAARPELTYLPAGIEGSTRTEVRGGMIGLTSIFVAALVRELARSADRPLGEAVSDGIRAGLSASRQLLREGLGPGTADPRTITEQAVGIAETPPDASFVSVTIAPEAGRQPNSRLFDYVRANSLESLAHDIVKHGIAAACPWAPVARFGALATVDRTEIEAYRSVRNLIRQYLAKPTDGEERPLSLAVFGPPGSGKSYGVLQVAKSLADIEKLEFNVSQFESLRQLTGAFHKVRDAIVRGRVPLVFFDEFDSGKDGHQMAWLKHFLAPMQDGKFTDGESVHSIGRSILVFAGGTKHSYAAFARRQQKDQAFTDAKGPDFVSRLRGFIDVRGAETSNDVMYVIRRATLLRSLLTRKAPALVSSGELRIDADLLRGFLRCSSFAHGVRSIESLIDMSALSDREMFERASLPSPEQLNLHMDGEEFMALVTQDIRLAEHREPLARAIHERFVTKQRGLKDDRDPSMRPWEDLPDHYRQDNLGQADDIPRKLALVKCGLRIADAGSAPETFTFTPDEIERLAEDEHERWDAAKRAQGFRYGPGDKTATTHPSMLPWADLEESEKQKDREAVIAIPEIVALGGFRVERLT